MGIVSQATTVNPATVVQTGVGRPVRDGSQKTVLVASVNKVQSSVKPKKLNEYCFCRISPIAVTRNKPLKKPSKLPVAPW